MVEALARTRVICVGDVMLDHYIRGRVERISPEAPVPVLHVEGEESRLGGAGNVLRNLHALGRRDLLHLGHGVPIPPAAKSRA